MGSPCQRANLANPGQSALSQQALSRNRFAERPAVLDSLGTSCKVKFHGNPLKDPQTDDRQERDGAERNVEIYF